MSSTWESVMNNTELTNFANNVKEQVIHALAREGLLNHPDNIAGNYAVIIHSKRFLGKIWERLRGMTENTKEGCFYITIVKSVDGKYEEEK